MSTTPLSFTGVSTFSNDFQTILSRQLQIAQIPLTRLQNSQSDDSGKKSLLTTLNTAVGSLASSIAALGAVGGNKALLASSSDPSISVTNTGAAQPASYTITNFQSLAKAASETSVLGYADSSSTPVPANVQLVLGSSSYSITLGAGKNNLAGLRDAINASGAPVTASILTTGTGANPNYLVVSANNNGATTLQVNDVTNPASPAALLNHAQPLAENSALTYADPATTPVSSNNSLQLKLGSNTYNITLAGGENNLNGLVSEINNIAGNPVTASISTSNGTSTLVVTASQIGATTLQLNDIPAAGPSTNLLSTVNNNANQGSNAVFQLNGLNISKTTNYINDMIPGVTFNLITPTTKTVTLSLNSDRGKLSSALSNLATQYNAVVDQVNAQMGPNAGLLNGDIAVRSVIDDMRQLTTYQVTGTNQTSLATLGVTFDTSGKMSYDATAVNGLTDSQLADAFTYLGSSSKGFGAIAAQFTQLSDPVSGLIKTEQTGLDTAYRHISNQIDSLHTRISVMQNALIQQLQRADAAVAALQSQQQVLTSSVQAVNLAMYGKNFGSAGGWPRGSPGEQQ